MESSPVQNRHAHSKAPSLSECCAVIHVISTIRLSDFLHPFACLFVRRTYGHSYHYSAPSGHVRGGCKTSQFTTHGFHHMLPTRHRGSRGIAPVASTSVIAFATRRLARPSRFTLTVLYFVRFRCSLRFCRKDNFTHPITGMHVSSANRTNR